MDEVPLIDKVQKNDINTTIIAIKKQLKELNALLGLIDIQSDKQDLSPYVRKDEVIDEVKRFDLSPVTSNAVANSLSYSTEEKKTGAYWIDGKPIYRKVVMFTNSMSWGANVWALIPNSSTDVPNAEQVTNFSTIELVVGIETNNFLGIGKHGDAGAGVNGIYYYSTVNINFKGYIIEYTKTTD